MAVTIATGSLVLGGAVVTTSGGNIYVFYGDNTSVKVLKSTDGGSSFSLINTLTDNDITGGDNLIGWIDAAIDSDNIIHIAVVAQIGAATRFLAYNTLNTADDTLSSWEEAAGGDKTPTYRGVSISLDSNKKPHILFVYAEANMGTTYNRIYYTNKVSGSWATPVMVSVDTTKNHNHPRITVKASDYLETVYTDDGYVYICRTKTSSWLSEVDYTTAASSPGVRSITVTTGGTVYRYGVGLNNPYYLEENDGILSADTLFSDYPCYGAGFIGTTRCVFWVDYSDEDIRVFKNSGTGWFAALLETGSFSKIITEWAYNFEYQGERINYIFDNGVTLYFNYYSLAQPAKSLVSKPQSRKTYLRM